jgi:predicted nucleotidyltransferase component of viral defense system
MNKQSLQARIDRLVQEQNIRPNDALRFYFFDEFIKRLSISPYKENFIFKGGFYLSSLLGITTRATMDIDFLLQKEPLQEENLAQIINAISQIDLADGISFSFVSIFPIRKEDPYGGYNIVLLGRLENIKQPISIDVATGDPITPNAIVYSYQTFFEKETVDCLAYNLETVLAEKLQTIFAKGELNSRCKDYYDVYILWEKERGNIDLPMLKMAFQRTCAHRNTSWDFQGLEKTIHRIEASEAFALRWIAYSRQREYTQNLPLSSCLTALKEIVSFLTD